jgi:hypothetical protein
MEETEDGARRAGSASLNAGERGAPGESLLQSSPQKLIRRFVAGQKPLTQTACSTTRSGLPMETAEHKPNGSPFRLSRSLDDRLSASPKNLAFSTADILTAGSSFDQRAFDSMLSAIYVPEHQTNTGFVDIALRCSAGRNN